MVHALQLTRQLLTPGGILVNVHDLPALPRLELHLDGAVTRVGWLLDREDFMEEHSASSALAQVVAASQYCLEDERDFNRNIYVDTLMEFQTWLKEKWSTTVLPEGTLQHIEALLGEVDQPAKIVVALLSRMTRLRMI